MSTILITNAISSGVAAFALLALRAARRRQRSVQRIYVTLDGRQLRRTEPAD